MEKILETFDLTKTYGTQNAVDGVSMTVNKGDIYGFVGLNGSGKTTLIRLITQLVRPTSGTFKLFGEEFKQSFFQSVDAEKRISSMVETPSIYLNMSAVDNLKVQCTIANIPIADNPERLLKLVGLDPTSKKKANSFSLGMRQRLGIAMALVVEPKLMLLDEPTNGLDPEGIIEIRNLLLHLNKEMGITILISSHILTELSKFATCYGFIHKGKLLKEASAQEVFDSCKTVISVECLNAQLLVSKLEKDFPVQLNGASVEVQGNDQTMSQILQVANDNKIVITNINKQEHGLEDYFINLIKSVDTNDTI
ncbi:MAG: ATP-binding cassette domain-containing protein [Firmicutes bacterium]|nr:ATP-binding cassette domain-containing protein [Bacillota bacterium]